MTVPSRVALHFAQGFLMGAADVVPGVSGGTVALVVGIYERLISSIRAAAATPVALARGRTAMARERLTEIDWRFIVPLVVGIASAIAIGSMVILPLRDAFPEGTRALFFGLVAASLVVPWRRLGERTPATLAMLVAAAVAAFVLVGLPPRDVTDPSLPQIIGSAAVAICAMILPGVSGAFLLEALGVYEATLTALRELDVAYIATFGLGAVVGLGLFARVLERLLERSHDLTMAALTGLMVGALRALWPWLADDRGLLVPPADGSGVAVAALALVGFVVLRLLLNLGTRIQSVS